MRKRVRIMGRAIPVWLAVLAMVAVGGGAAAGTILAGKVVGEIPVAVSQAILAGRPVAAADLMTLEYDAAHSLAEWSNADSYSGDYSLFLSDDGSGYAEVSFPVDIALGDINLSQTSYWAKTVSGGFIPYIMFELETGKLINDDGPAAAGFVNWAQYVTDSLGPAHLWQNDDGFTGAFPAPAGWSTWAEAVSHFGASTRVTRVLLENSGIGAGSAYVDDIEINGLIYPLDPGDLIGAGTVPQGTERHYDTPNRYVGVKSDDNTAFQFASEVAVGDMYLIAVPLKNASENDLVALLNMDVPAGIEVEVVSASDVHGNGVTSHHTTVTDAVRIGTNTWKFKVLKDAEYRALTDILYVAVSVDDDTPPGYYTIRGIIKQIPY